MPTNEICFTYSFFRIEFTQMIQGYAWLIAQGRASWNPYMVLKPYSWPTLGTHVLLWSQASLFWLCKFIYSNIFTVLKNLSKENLKLSPHCILLHK